MRIWIDGWFSSRSYKGIGNYIVDLVRSMGSIGPHDITVLVPEQMNRVCDVVEDSDRVHIERIAGPSESCEWFEALVVWQQECIGLALDREDPRPDVFLGPAFAAPLAWSGPTVVTVHDLGFAKPTRIDEDELSDYYQTWPELCARSSDAIIAVSQFTAGDIESIWGLGYKTHVVHQAPSLAWMPAQEEHSPEPPLVLASLDNLDLNCSRYLLYMGGYARRKNLSRLVAAFLESGLKDVQLVLCIDPKTELAYAAKSGRVHFAGYVPYDRLPALIARSCGVVYPSLHEGFGMPALEAAACGVPLAASDIPPIREILGDYPMYFDPNRVGSIRDALVSVVEHPTMARRTTPLSLSWENTALGTIRVLESVVRPDIRHR